MHAVRAYRKRKRVQNILKNYRKEQIGKKENCMKYADKIDEIVYVCSHDLLKFLTNTYQVFIWELVDVCTYI